MSKKKNREHATVESLEHPSDDSNVTGNPSELTKSAKDASSLTDEIQSFLAKRDELANKLAEEIEATEKKLAELKRTAALLCAESNAAPPKDKKVKKVKARGTSRQEVPASELPSVEDAA